MNFPDEPHIKEKIKELSGILFREREKRIKPALDDKVLTSWNAMMISALADAYEVFGDADFLKTAENAVEFILTEMMQKDGGIYRTIKNGKAKIKGFLDDYAFLTDALIRLFQVSGKEHYIYSAKSFTDYVFDHFVDKESPMFFYASDTAYNLIVRQKEVSDNVIPASNSITAKNLYRLGVIFSDSELINKAEQMVLSVHDNIIRNSEYFGNWASFFQFMARKKYEAVITGKLSGEIKSKLCSVFRPDVFTLFSQKESEIPIFKSRFADSKNLIYICEDMVCKIPVETIEDAFKLLKTG